MSGRRKDPDPSPSPSAKKSSRWRFGRRRTSSKTEGSSSSTPAERAPPVHVAVSPASPVGVTSDVEDRHAPDRGIRALVHSLSLKDDPRMFGTGTIAARRMQREELDAAMAQTLFSRELAMVPQPVPQPASPTDTLSNGAVETTTRVDLKPLLHLRPAFTDEQWTRFTTDPLRYIHVHGLPQEVQVVDVSNTHTNSSTQGLPEQLILPPEAAQLLQSTLASTAMQVSDAGTSLPERGLTSGEISRLLTTFNQQGTVRHTDSKKRPSRVRGRGALPKGAKTKGILSEEEATECSICLLDFEAGQRVGLLPCCHRFHADCVMDWLQRDATCPECREELRNHLH